jgi:hypothetical protein
VTLYVKHKELNLSEENNQIKEKTDFLLDVIKRYDHYVATTNFKVGLMMSFIGAIVLGLTIRVLLLDPIQDEITCIRYATVAAIFLTISSSLYAAIQLLRVVFPNTQNVNGADSLVFFGSVVTENTDSEGYYRKVLSTEPVEMLRDLATQTYNMAGVVNHKFKVLKIAVNAMMYATIPLLALSLALLVFEGQ